MVEWREDIKIMMNKTGVEDKLKEAPGYYF